MTTPKPRRRVRRLILPAVLLGLVLSTFAFLAAASDPAFQEWASAYVPPAPKIQAGQTDAPSIRSTKPRKVAGNNIEPPKGGLRPIFDAAGKPVLDPEGNQVIAEDADQTGTDVPFETWTQVGRDGREYVVTSFPFNRPGDVKIVGQEPLPYRAAAWGVAAVSAVLSLTLIGRWFHFDTKARPLT